MKLVGFLLAVLTLSICGPWIAEKNRYPYKRGCSVREQTEGETVEWRILAEQFMLQHSDHCPNSLGVVSPGRRPEYQFDAWGRPYELTCRAGKGVRVCSLGDDAYDPGDDICSDD